MLQFGCAIEAEVTFAENVWPIVATAAIIAAIASRANVRDALSAIVAGVALTMAFTTIAI